MTVALTQAEPQFDALLTSRVCLVSTSSAAHPSVLLKLGLASNVNPSTPLASLGLRLLAKSGQQLLEQRLICRQITRLVKDGLAEGRIETGQIKLHLGLAGAYTDFGLALQILEWVIRQTEDGHASAVFGSGAGETQAQQDQYYLILTVPAPDFSLNLTFFLDAVPHQLALVVLERHFFAPLVGTLATSLALDRARPPGEARSSRTGQELEAAVDASACAARDADGEGGGGLSHALGDRRWSQAVARWTAVASGVVDSTDLPRIDDNVDVPKAVATSSEEADEIQLNSTPSPPPPVQPAKGRRIQPSRDKSRTSIGARILDHHRQDLPGVRLGWDETQTQAGSRSESPIRRPGPSTGLSSQLEVATLSRSSRKGKGRETDRGRALVIDIGSSDGEPEMVTEEDEEPDTEPEATPSPSPAEPDTEEDDDAPPTSYLVTLPNLPDTQSQPRRPRSSQPSPTKSTSSLARREPSFSQRSPTKPPWAVGHQPPPPVSPTKRKAGEGEASSASIAVAGSPPKPPVDKRKALMEQRRRAQLRKKSG